MRSRWGDDMDEELQKDEKIKVGFLFNYMQMGSLLKRIEEETKEWDEKYPKSELLKVWGSVMGIMLVLFTLSYNVLLIVTGLFFFFYGHILIQVYGVWKRFQYSKKVYWGMTIGALAVAFVLGWLLRSLIFGG